MSNSFQGFDVRLLRTRTKLATAKETDPFADVHALADAINAKDDRVTIGSRDRSAWTFL
jgi:hypothetical protein